MGAVGVDTSVFALLTDFKKGADVVVAEESGWEMGHGVVKVADQGKILKARFYFTVFYAP